ncbi:thioesterase family protein [Roseobacteraceae bacterium S113]
MIWHYETDIAPDWIDYNGHMRDAYYGLIYSLAVDAFQDAVGFDAAYRTASGCTIYLLAQHTSFLREVKLGMRARVETRLLEVTEKRFHLHMTMREAGEIVSVSEVMEAHVRQHPKPHTAPMPAGIRANLQASTLDPAARAALAHRARPIGRL